MDKICRIYDMSQLSKDIILIYTTINIPKISDAYRIWSELFGLWIIGK